jgi:hypothetical protein
MLVARSKASTVGKPNDHSKDLRQLSMMRKTPCAPIRITPGTSHASEAARSSHFEAVILETTILPLRETILNAAPATHTWVLSNTRI